MECCGQDPPQWEERERAEEREGVFFLRVCVCFAFENTRQDVSCASPSASDQVHVDS